MTDNTSKTISPDSLTGILFGAEGVRNTVVLLNGPMGCKFYHSTTSQFLMDRPPLYLPVTENGKKVEVNYSYMNDWFFRQSRVPCTYLDQYDYVYGTADKVEQGLCYLRDNVAFDLLTVVNAPGASLIGDNLRELISRILPDRPTVHIESPGYSEGFSAGYETLSLCTLRQLAPLMSKRGKGKKKRVNLLGLSIWHRYAQGDRDELMRLFHMCGIEIGCCLFSGCSVDELLSIPEADLNIVIHPDMCLKAAEYLQEIYGTPCHVCPGPPIGFDAVEELFRAIAPILNADISPLLSESKKCRGLAWYKLSQIYQACGLPKGAGFAVEGTLPIVFSYARFLGEYLGMRPVCISCENHTPSATAQSLQSLLKELQDDRCEHEDITTTSAELVFGNANTIAALMTKSHAFCGIEISLPGMGYTDLIPKTHLGLQGSLFLIEQVINGLMSKI